MQEISMNSGDSANPAIRPYVPQKPRIRRFRTLRVVAALIMRETGSRETRTSLGFLWNMIDPVASVFVLTVAFSLFAKNPPLGTNFPLFYITGVLPFTMYGQVENRVSGSIRFSRPLLGFPAVTVLDALLARFLLNVFTNVVVFVTLASIIIMQYHLRVTIDARAVVLSLAMAAALGLGIGTLNSVLYLASPTYQSVWGIINRPQMLVSGVIFLLNDMPDFVFKYLKWNPVAHVIAEMRHGFYPTYDSSFVNPTYVFIVAGTAFVLGLVGLHSYVFDALEK
ncbi:sugar ABC transporter permease [bacterium]|nr:sugar ABC transporter permease [bacterium]